MASQINPSNTSERNTKPARQKVARSIARTIPNDSPVAQRLIAITLAYGPSQGERKLWGPASWLNRENLIDPEAELRDISSPPQKAEKEEQKTKATAPKKKAEVKAEVRTAAKSKPAQKSQAPEASMGVGHLFGWVLPSPLPAAHDGGPALNQFLVPKTDWAKLAG
jgi:hypothetical protein